MKITVGSNIRRLRTEKGVTQEQLARAMNITCASVSKWERGDSYPDISLLQPLAFYFGVTLDELMGYDKEKIQEEIDKVIAEYRSCWTKDQERARALIVDAYREFPNDCRIMHYYMWNVAGDLADNDPAVLLAYKEEFRMICEKILDSCTDETIRLNAWNMKAKLLWAEGDVEGALEIYRSKFVNWYTTVGQKSEQLFPKDTPEFLYWVRKNMFELIGFAGDKLAKSCFFDRELLYEERVSSAERCGDEMLRLGRAWKEPFFLVLAEAVLRGLYSNLRRRGGKEDDVTRLKNKYLDARSEIAVFAQDNVPLHDAVF